MEISKESHNKQLSRCLIAEHDLRVAKNENAALSSQCRALEAQVAEQAAEIAKLKEQLGKSPRFRNPSTGREISRSHAVKLALDKAVLLYYPKPALCQRCKAKSPIHRHHLINAKHIRDWEIDHLANQHFIRWLCSDCHDACHGRHVPRIPKGRKKTAKTLIFDEN
jgi:hypothetical protein